MLFNYFINKFHGPVLDVFKAFLSSGKCDKMGHQPPLLITIIRALSHFFKRQAFPFAKSISFNASFLTSSLDSLRFIISAVV